MNPFWLVQRRNKSLFVLLVVRCIIENDSHRILLLPGSHQILLLRRRGSRNSSCFCSSSVYSKQPTCHIPAAVICDPIFQDHICASACSLSGLGWSHDGGKKVPSTANKLVPLNQLQDQLRHRAKWRPPLSARTLLLRSLDVLDAPSAMSSDHQGGYSFFQGNSDPQQRVYKSLWEATVIVAQVFRCSSCNEFHCTVASGFFILPTGAFVTNYHVVSQLSTDDLENAKKRHQNTCRITAEKNALCSEPRAEDGHRSLIVVGSNRVVWPVKAVLAGSKALDIAILQVDLTSSVTMNDPMNNTTDDEQENMHRSQQQRAASSSITGQNVRLFCTRFVPFLPITRRHSTSQYGPPPGSLVSVLSHPEGHFFMFTEGIVSRYFCRAEHDSALWSTKNFGGDAEGRRTRVVGLCMTADIAKGSSGAPVFYPKEGSVIGIADSTRTIYYDGNPPRNPQMVIKTAIPATYVFDLLDLSATTRAAEEKIHQ